MITVMQNSNENRDRAGDGGGDSSDEKTQLRRVQSVFLLQSLQRPYTAFTSFYILCV